MFCKSRTIYEAMQCNGILSCHRILNDELNMPNQWFVFTLFPGKCLLESAAEWIVRKSGAAITQTGLPAVTQGASSASTFTASTASTSFTATTTSSTATPSTTATRMLAALLVLPLCQAFTVSYSGHAEAPVLVELYYESFCPGCRAFLTGMLYPAYDKLKDTGVMEVRPT